MDEAKRLENVPVHKKITQTKYVSVDNDDFDPEEAIEAAVEKRKFLIKRPLKNCNLPSIWNFVMLNKFIKIHI